VMVELAQEHNPTRSTTLVSLLDGLIFLFCWACRKAGFHHSLIPPSGAYWAYMAPVNYTRNYVLPMTN
jgi:hypothetical protein